MTNRQQIQEIPGALRITLEKARAEYGATLRKIRWADGPVYVCGTGACGALGVAAGYAFETFPGWPVVARPVEFLQSAALRLLPPRSVLLMISAGGESPEAQELAHTAHQRGCTIVALAGNSESALAKLADQVFLIRAEGDADSPPVIVCLHAALNFLALEAARVFKRPEAQWNSMAEEFEQLPDKVEWVFTQLPALVRSFADDLMRLTRIKIAGGGFYHFPARHAAWRLRSLVRPVVNDVEASECLHAHGAVRGEGLLFLSGSHASFKKVVQRSAAQARTNGARIFSITDSNDRALVEGADLGILLPALQEPPSSTLTTFMLEWLAMEILRAQRDEPAGNPSTKGKTPA